MNESQIIEYFFKSLTDNSDISLGIGDDAAVIDIPHGFQSVISTDTLVSGVHFFPNQNAAEIAHKALAVNLSDMAAMAAEPRWFSLSLTLPELKQDWMTLFCSGLKKLADQFNVSLIGGDLAKGPLSITITIQGLVPEQQYITRHQAQMGDHIFISGTLGDAGLVLALEQDNPEQKQYDVIKQRLHSPQPRVELGMRLRNIATSMIDLSDGLIIDLQRILAASNKGARLFLDSLPLSLTLQDLTTRDEALHYALSSGDDYELCFTAPGNLRSQIDAIQAELNLPLTCVGEITEKTDLELFNDKGERVENNYAGFQHFS